MIKAALENGLEVLGIEAIGTNLRVLTGKPAKQPPSPRPRTRPMEDATEADLDAAIDEELALSAAIDSDK